MKRFVKNSVLAMLVICFLLNVVNFIGLIFEYYMNTPLIVETAREVSQEIQSSEEVYQALSQFYYSGNGAKAQVQGVILISSIILGTVIGLMIEIEKKAKAKLVLEYCVGLIMIVIVSVIYNVAKGYFEILKNLEWIFIVYGGWYTVIFIIVYAFKISISNKDAKKLNEILNKKSK